MSTTIQIVLIICVAVVLVVDILNIKKNEQLQHQINICSELHRQLLSIIVEQENVISNELDILCDDLWDNKVDKLVMQITEACKAEGVPLCSYHNQVTEVYREWQNEMAAKIKHIKRKQNNITNKMRDILDINNYKYEE